MGRLIPKVSPCAKVKLDEVVCAKKSHLSALHSCVVAISPRVSRPCDCAFFFMILGAPVYGWFFFQFDLHAMLSNNAGPVEDTCATRKQGTHLLFNSETG